VIKSYGQGGSGKNKIKEKEKMEKQVVATTLNVLQLRLLNQKKMLMIM
jgi:hypothetical protein